MKKLIFASVLTGLFLNSSAFAQAVKISSPFYAGSGCPEGSVSASLTEDQSTISFLFDQFRIDAGSDIGVTDKRANCAINLKVKVPVGYRLEVSRIDYRGFAVISEGTLFSLKTDSFNMPADNGAVRVENNMSLEGSDNFVLAHRIFNTFKYSCKPNQTLSFNTQLALTARNGVQGSASAGIDSADIGGASQDSEGALDFAIRLKRCDPKEAVTAPAINLGWYYSPESYVAMKRSDLLINLLYEAILFRAPDSSELDYYQPKVQARGLQGLDQVAQSIILSSEWSTQIRSQHSDEEIVRQLYRLLLGREPDQGGLQWWTPMMQNNQSQAVISGFINSQEFKRRNIMPGGY